MERRTVLFVVSVMTININIYTAQAVSSDPCKPTVYETFPTLHFGSRNEKCNKTRNSICDYYLREKWYVLQNSTLLDHCPQMGKCGTTYPAWMAGQLPAKADGIVNRTVCIMIQNDCCKEQVKIRVKNCTDFFVYYLTPLNECSGAYCIESSQPCTELDKPDGKGKTIKPIGPLVKDGSDIKKYVQGPADNSTVIIVCSVLAGVIGIVGAGVITAIFCYRQSVKINRQVNTDYETAAPVPDDSGYYETLPAGNKDQVDIIA